MKSSSSLTLPRWPHRGPSLIRSWYCCGTTDCSVCRNLRGVPQQGRNEAKTEKLKGPEAVISGHINQCSSSVSLHLKNTCLPKIPELSCAARKWGLRGGDSTVKGWICQEATFRQKRQRGSLRTFTTVNPTSLQVVPGASCHPLAPQGQALWGVQQAGGKGSQKIWHKQEVSRISSFLSKTVSSFTSRWESAQTPQILLGKDLSGTVFAAPVTPPPPALL